MKRNKSFMKTLNSDVMMSAMASQITGVSIIYSTVCSGAELKKKSKLRVTGLCAGNSPVTGEFPAQRASNAENVSIWWRHHALQWRHDERGGVSNHRRLDYLFNRLFSRRSKKTSKLRITGLCEGNSPVTGEFPSQRTSNAENVSIWLRHHSAWFNNMG